MSEKKYITVVAACVGALGVAICLANVLDDNKSKTGGNRGNAIKTTAQIEETNVADKRYNKEDIVVVTHVDVENLKVTVKKPEESAEFVLTYNGGTVVKSKYGNQLMMEQITAGEIVRVGYVSGTHKLIELQQYGDAFENTMATRWDVDYDKKLITIGSDTYSYDDNIYIVSNGKNVDIREISGIDELTVRGIGNKIYSVSVTKGHGFVKLTNTQNYVGGIIEIGDRLSTVIVEDMILAAPEGTFNLTATINGVGGSKEIQVIRGQETVVSLGSFEQSVTRYGTVKLNVFPEDAQATLTVDGAEMDYTDLLSIPYGKHTLKLMSNNYDTVTKQITISSVYSTININMSEEETTSDGSVTESTTSSNTETNTGEETTTKEEETTGTSNPGSSNGFICITAPEGAKVYFDGAYMGVSPLAFDKVEGEHTIIFKKDGYVTKSYTIDVSDDEEDMILSFPAMLEGN